MKKLKKLITYICLLTILVTSVDMNNVFAGVSDPADYSDYYTQLFSTKASPYLISCQPSSAILLTDTVTLTPDINNINMSIVGSFCLMVTVTIKFG